MKLLQATLITAHLLVVGCSAKADPARVATSPAPAVTSPAPAATGPAVATAPSPLPPLPKGDGVGPATPLALEPGAPLQDLMPCGQPWYFRPNTKPGAPFDLTFAIQTPDVPKACVHLSFTKLDASAPTAPVTQCTGKKAPDWDELTVHYDGTLGAPLVRLDADSTCQGVFYRLVVR